MEQKIADIHKLVILCVFVVCEKYTIFYRSISFSFETSEDNPDMQATLQSLTEALNSTTKGHNGRDNAEAEKTKDVYELAGATRHSNPQQDQDANLVEKDGVSSEHIEECDSAQTINSTDNNKIVQPSVEESLFNETSIDINAQDSVILSEQKGSCKRAGGKTNNKSNRKKTKLSNSSKDDKIITRLDLFYFENFKMME